MEEIFAHLMCKDFFRFSSTFSIAVLNDKFIASE